MTSEAPDRRSIAVVTVGRSDYGIYAPVLAALERESSLDIGLIVAGAHLSGRSSTIAEVEAAGHSIRDRVEMLLDSDRAEGTAKAMGLGTIGFAQAFAREKPDILLVLGDRFEMHAAVVAALPFNIPVAHIHGGEVTTGAFDDALRHSITKLSHLHFPATEDFSRRLVSMGEDPWRITVAGAPSLDNLRLRPIPPPRAIEERFGLRLTPAPLLANYHPVTRDPSASLAELSEILAALEACGQPVVFTAPNADPGAREARMLIETFVARVSRADFVESFGSDHYFGMLAAAAAMIGNSSSGIIEAASFGLPVVNVGHRQDGRPRSANVIDVEGRRSVILEAIDRAMSGTFRFSLAGLVNVYGDGHSAAKIAEVLASVPLDRTLLAKGFHDAASSARGAPATRLR